MVLIRIGMADQYGNKDRMLEAILSVLRSTNPEPYELRAIADMIDPKSKRGKFRLELKHRRGNHRQRDPRYYERVVRVGEIYQETGWDTVKTVQIAAMPVSEGGVGKSETTVRHYLKSWIAYEEAQNEALEANLEAAAEE